MSYIYAGPGQEDNIHKFMEMVQMMPKQLPQYINVDGVRSKVIPFEELAKIQITRWEINPIVQEWATPPNKIITIYDINGTSYMVKARHDQETNQLLPPQ